MFDALKRLIDPDHVESEDARVLLAWAKAEGHAFKHVKGKTEFVDVERFTAEQVTPPEGVKSEDWIKSNFKQ